MTGGGGGTRRRLCHRRKGRGLAQMKLSIVIICWNDWKVIRNCLESIYANTHSTEFEVIISDNGSTDGSVEFIRQNYPQARVIENKANLGFARGNNAGIRISGGELILILNPDTLIHDGSLDRWVTFVGRHLEAGAFGCRILNSDGSYQKSGRPFPTVLRQWVASLYLWCLGYLSESLTPEYVAWKGDSERTVDWQSGCCVMFRGELLRYLGGFDEQFFYHSEEVDLCRRVWQAGYSIWFTPEAAITHLGGQSVKRFPAAFELEKHRNYYRYFYKHHGARATRRFRWAVQVGLRMRQLGYALAQRRKPTDERKSRLEMYRVVAQWNRRLDPVALVERGEEPKAEIPVPVRAS